LTAFDSKCIIVCMMSIDDLLCADALQTGASQFEANTGKLKRKYFWQNVKVFFI